MDESNYKQLKPRLSPLPCPFCGKAPAIQPLVPSEEGDAWGRVECVNGRCPVQPSCRDGARQSDMRGPGAYIDAAIRRWNRRATPQEKQE